MVYVKRSRRLLDAVMENSQLLIAIGAIISFLIIGTVVGFAVNRVLGKICL
jgi:hypothetical protein